jgi:hypothetical protein
MLLVASAVTAQGNLVPVAVIVQNPPRVGKVAVQCPPKVAAVIDRCVALATVVVNVELVHDEITCPTPSGSVVVNPKSGDVSECSEPAVVQLTALAIDGNTNAQNVDAVTSSKTPFVDNSLMMLLVSPSRRRDNWLDHDQRRLW